MDWNRHGPFTDLACKEDMCSELKIGSNWSRNYNIKWQGIFENLNGDGSNSNQSKFI